MSKLVRKFEEKKKELWAKRLGLRKKYAPSTASGKHDACQPTLLLLRHGDRRQKSGAQARGGSGRRERRGKILSSVAAPAVAGTWTTSSCARGDVTK
jgi:hypothetical protein